MNYKAYVVVFMAVIIAALCVMVAIVSEEDYSDVGKTFTHDGINYVITQSDSVKISGFESVEPNLILNSEVTFNGKTYSLVSIEDSAFIDCDTLRTLAIPGTVTSIGTSAFKGCVNLVELTIPVSLNSVVKNSHAAFSGCEKIEKVTLIAGTGNAHDYSDNKYTPWCISKVFTTLVVAEGVKHIGNYTFKDCAKLSEVTFPSTLIDIRHSAFENCKSIETLCLPDSVKTVEISAFKNLKGLRHLTLPITAEVADSRFNKEFEGTNGIEEIVITKGSSGKGPDYGSMSESIYYTRAPWFESKESLKSVKFEEGVVEIGKCMFMGCQLIESLSFPDTLEKIGFRAFMDVKSLECLNLPKRLETICEYSFENCEIKELIMPVHIDYVSEQTSTLFGGCYGLEKLTLTQGFLDGPSNAFTYKDRRFWQSCDDTFKTLVVEEGVESIYAYMFQGCKALANISLPDSLKSIPHSAFEDCPSLTSIRIPDSVTSLGQAAFKNCNSIVELTVPISLNTVNKDRDPVFDGCNNISKVTFTPGKGNGHDYDENTYTPWRISKDTCKTIILSEGIKAIGDYTFKNCSAITDIVLPNSLIKIKHSAFEGCKGLTELTIPDSVTSLGNAAFKNCTNITKLTVPISLNTVVKNNDPAFDGCKKIETVTLTAGTGHGHEYGDNTYTPWHISKGSFKNLIVADGVKIIGMNTFKGCDNLQNIRFGKGLESIGLDAFKGFHFFDSDGVTKLSIDAEHLKGCTFSGKKSAMVKQTA